MGSVLSERLLGKLYILYSVLLTYMYVPVDVDVRSPFV